MINIEEVLKLQKQQEEEDKKFKEHLLELRKRELEKEGLALIEFNSNKQPKQQFDHPDTMENGPATLLYIAVMLGGSIFNDRWLIWIVATVVFFKFLTRHSR